MEEHHQAIRKKEVEVARIRRATELDEPASQSGGVLLEQGARVGPAGLQGVGVEYLHPAEIEKADARVEEAVVAGVRIGVESPVSKKCTARRSPRSPLRRGPARPAWLGWKTRRRTTRRPTTS